jgi:threonine/homoserine/homoserine lactone efflux protein
LAVVGGIALSNIILFTTCLLAVEEITALSVIARQVLKITFAMYLGWLGLKAIRSGAVTRRKEVSGVHSIEAGPGDDDQDGLIHCGKIAIGEYGDSLKAGCMTSITNPSSISYFLSLSAVLVENNTSTLIRVGAILGIVSAVIVSYGSFVFLSSWPPLMKAVRSVAGWLDIVTGSLFLLLSISLLLS